MPPSPFRANGGSLPPDDPTYVKRRADHDFYAALHQGDYCYVLNSRQMGKSSLGSRTRQRLEQAGRVCATFDLSGDMDTNVTPETWYYTLANLLGRQLGILPDLNLWQWWSQQDPLPPQTRFSTFLRDILLEQIAAPIVIFIDEIDTILSLENIRRDDFFALVRACYNRRDHDPAYRRLTFALLGVATPADLIQDNERTPFNIGRSIQLTGFTLAEAQPLAAGLATAVADPQATLQAILTWTGGQPFLTQKLCDQVLQTPPTANAALDLPTYVNDLVRTHLITNWEAKDDPEHLRTIQTRILAQEQRATRVLALYDQILKGEPVPSTGSPTQVDLRLSGLVVEHQGQLQVYNPIYAQVFNAQWVTESLAKIRPYASPINAWEASSRQDDDCLLRGEALTQALAWAANRTLSPADYDFLLESQKLDLRQELEQANFELSELTDELVEKTQERDQAQAELQRVNAELERVNGELSRVTGEFNRVNEELTEARHELIAARHDLRRVQRNTRRWSWIGAAVLATAMIGLVSSFVEANRQKSIAADFETQAAAARLEKDQAVGEKDQTLEQNQQLNQNNQTLKKSNQNLADQNNDLDAENQELEAQNQTVAQDLTNSKAQFEQVSGQLGQVQGELTNKNQELSNKNQEFQELSTKVTTLTTEADNLRTERDNLNNQIGELIEAGQQTTQALQQTIGTLGIQRVRNTYYLLGGFDDAIEYLEKSLAQARTFQDRRGEGYANGNLGTMHATLGNYPKALEHHQEHRAIAQEVQDRQGEMQAEGNLGKVLYSQGKYNEAQPQLEKSLVLAQAAQGQTGRKPDPGLPRPHLPGPGATHQSPGT
jgi:predicted nuclease with TOPRIM domain